MDTCKEVKSELTCLFQHFADRYLTKPIQTAATQEVTRTDLNDQQLCQALFSGAVHLS